MENYFVTKGVSYLFLAEQDADTKEFEVSFLDDNSVNGKKEIEILSNCGDEVKITFDQLPGFIDMLSDFLKLYK